MSVARRKFVEQVVFLGAVVVFLVFTSKVLVGLFAPLLFGFAIALALRPLTIRIAKNTGLRRRASAVLAAGFFYLVLTFLLVAASAYLLGQISLLIHELPGFLSTQLMPGLEALNTRIVAFLSGLSEEMGIGAKSFFEASSAATLSIVTSFSGSAAHFATAFAAKLPIYALGAVFTVALSVFISADFQNFREFVMRQLSPTQQEIVHEVSAFGGTCLLKIGKAYGILFLITAVEIGVGLYFLGVPSFFSAAIIIAALDILPAIGSIVAFVPWAGISFVSGNSALGAGLLLLFFTVEFIRNFLEPKIVGEQTGLSPIVTISAMFAGVQLMGFLGVILAPIAVLFIKHLNSKGIISLYK